MRKGILLINLGTPDAPTPEAVGAYLRQFLMDPEVVDLPFIFRWFLVNRVIVPKRSVASAELYTRIWTGDGSPLLIHSQDLARKLEAHMGPDYVVRVGMRYGSPSLQKGLLDLGIAGAKPVLAIPLYPQYARATTESSLLELRKAEDMLTMNNIRTMSPFYNQRAFLDAFAQILKPQLEYANPDHVLFSYHGLPERQIKREDRSGKHCLMNAQCCEEITAQNRNCYRAHCVQTTRSLTARLGLPPEKHSLSFQSRLGRTKWISPYTEEKIKELAQRGVKHLAVACPSFVADCLETLEEIKIRGEETFLHAGGKKFTLLTSLNSEDAWIQALGQMVQEYLENPSPEGKADRAPAER